MTVLHIILLHKEGSTNPLGVCANIRFYPKYIVKDIFGFFAVLGPIFIITVFFYPN
jgi:quinol-cytochrome oxidoreductase complex cytochrome b subunit